MDARTPEGDDAPTATSQDGLPLAVDDDSAPQVIALPSPSPAPPSATDTATPEQESLSTVSHSLNEAQSPQPPLAATQESSKGEDWVELPSRHM